LETDFIQYITYVDNSSSLPIAIISGSDIVLCRLDIFFSNRPICFTGKFLAYMQSSVTVLRQRKTSICFHGSYICIFKVFTGWFRGNLSCFLKEFLRLNYIYVIKKTYIRSWTLSVVIARDLKKITAVIYIYLLITKYIIKRGEFAVSVMLTPLRNI
jgi:hypothetical protein